MEPSDTPIPSRFWQGNEWIRRFDDKHEKNHKQKYRLVAYAISKKSKWTN
jgi:hypothetical protein